MVYIQKYRWNKFGNTKCTYNGSNYDSKLEADYAQELDLRLKAKDILGWDRQFKVSIDINGFHICNYYVDFRIYEKDKSYTFLETKGFETDVFRMKKKLLEAVWLPENPDYQYEIVKQNTRRKK